MNIKTNHQKIKETIPSNITLIAVSKKQPIEKIQQLIELKHKDFGENYVQELIQKHQQLQKEDLQWHFIGHLQSNKVKKLLNTIPNVIIHTLDSIKLAEIINKHASQPIQCFIQVNIDQEESKFGILPDETKEFYNNLKKFKNINCIGLMSISQKSNHTSFQKMKQLRDSINPSLKLSMGMSQDYNDAIKWGATHIRIGTALFGQRF